MPTIGGLEANRDSVIRRTADITFALDQIEGLAKAANATFRDRLDLSRVGALGHSEGGKAAVRACQTDRRLRACLNQDGEMFGIPFTLTNPIPSLRADRFIETPVLVIYVAEPGVSDAQLATAKVTRTQY
jgi:dienelactone hydrolase